MILGTTKIYQKQVLLEEIFKIFRFSTAAATLACETPIIKSIPYVVKPEEITPGVANWYASTFYDGNDFANILLKLEREDRYSLKETIYLHHLLQTQELFLLFYRFTIRIALKVMKNGESVTWSDC